MSLTIQNIHKIDNMEWETQRGSGHTNVKCKAEIKEMVKEKYLIQFTKEYHTHTQNVIPNGERRTIVMEIGRKGLISGDYWIGVFEGGKMASVLHRKVTEITIPWIMGVIERT